MELLTGYVLFYFSHHRSLPFEIGNFRSLGVPSYRYTQSVHRGADYLWYGQAIFCVDVFLSHDNKEFQILMLLADVPCGWIYYYVPMADNFQVNI